MFGCPVISLHSKLHTGPASALISVWSYLFIYSHHWSRFSNSDVSEASRRRHSRGFGIVYDSHSFGPSSGILGLAWEAEEEDEDDEDEELRRVSTPVLDIFSLRRLASGALSTLFRKKPSRLPLLNAWEKHRQKKLLIKKKKKSINKIIIIIIIIILFLLSENSTNADVSFHTRPMWLERPCSKGQCDRRNILITPWMTVNSQKHLRVLHKAVACFCLFYSNRNVAIMGTTKCPHNPALHSGGSISER